MDRVRILTYHRVGVPRGGRTEKLTVTPDRFARQLRLLEILRQPFGDLDGTAAWLRGEQARIGRPVVLTFDDGYAAIDRYALPLLLERGLSAVVYLVAERRQDRWVDWGGKPALPLLDWRQIRELADRGIVFGSHSLTHPDLTRLGPARLRAEVTDSRKRIEDQVGRAVHHFCYPFGAWDARVREAVQEAGYTTSCSTRRGAVVRGCDPLGLPRLGVGKTMGLVRFGLRVMGRRGGGRRRSRERGAGAGG